MFVVTGIQGGRTVFAVTSFTGRENLCSEKGSSVSRLHVVSEQAQIVSQVLSWLTDSSGVLVSQLGVPIFQMVRQALAKGLEVPWLATESRDSHPTSSGV